MAARGPQLLLNNDFTTWVADDPSSWTIVVDPGGSEVGGTAEVTEAIANGTVTVGGDHCKMVSTNAGYAIEISQDVLATGQKYIVELKITAISGSGVQAKLGTGELSPTYTSTGTYTFIGECTSSTDFVLSISGVTAITMEYVTVSTYNSPNKELDILLNGDFAGVLGTELVNNGDFATGDSTGWSDGGSVSYAGFNAVISGNTYLFQDTITGSVGSKYLLTYERSVKKILIYNAEGRISSN